MTYRKFIKKLFWLFILGVFIILMIFYRWYLLDFSLPNLYQFLAASLFPLGLVARAFLWVFPAIYSQYEIYNNMLVRTFLGKKEEFPFSNIRDIRFSLLSARFSGGYSLIFKNGRKLRIPSFLINSDELLKKIMAFKPEAIEEKKANKYLKYFYAIDASWIRSKRKLKSPYRFLIHLLLLPLAFAYLIQDYGDFSSLEMDATLVFSLHFFLAYVFLFLSNSVEEFVIQNYSEKLENPTWLIVSADWLGNGFYYILLVAYLILTKSLPTIFL